MLDISKYPLDSREGLPDALRVLLEDHPREAWDSHPQFHGLVSFWMDRHMMFRRLLEVLGTETESMLDGRADPQRYVAGLGRYGGMLVSQLHGHHQIEDHHYFPVLARRDARIARGFDILDADHHALDAYLNGFVEAANGAIRGVQDGPDPNAAVGAFRTELVRLDGLLDRHLTDEEELVVPVILKYGEQGLG